MTVQTTYRTCPRSGLQFEKQAEALMKINAVTAVVALLVGGLLAIGVVLTRWPAVHWLAADTFYMVLTAHGIDMLIFWIIFFEVAVLYFASSTLLRCRIATPKIAWLGFALMLIAWARGGQLGRRGQGYHAILEFPVACGITVGGALQTSQC